jgi:hypothetical protein
MDWIKQNKFLAGFLAFLAVVGGAFGFLTYTAKGKYDQAVDAYQSKAQELKTLQNQQPYPSEANVKKMLDAQKAHQAAIDSLQKELAKAQIPLKPITPEKFQDNLRESVRRITALANDRGVVMPKENKFYMGFDAYQSAPPKPEVTPLLERQLEAMEKAMTLLMESSITELKDIKRDPLPDESGKAGSPPSAPAKTAKKDQKKPLVDRNEFQIEFVTPEGQLQKFVNSLVSSTEQFYVPKSIDVANQKDKGPSKVEADAGVGTPQTPPSVPGGPSATPGAPAPAAPMKYVLGDEKLNVGARIEIVNFAELTAK